MDERVWVMNRLRNALRGLLVLLITVFMIQGCKSDDQPDVSNIKIALRTKRLDRDLAAIDTAHIAEGLKRMKPQYPEFLDFYLDEILGFGIKGDYNDTNAGIRKGLYTFLTYKDYKGLFDTIALHFPDTKQPDEDLTRGFQYLKHYFPGFHVPEIIYLNSGLNNLAAFSYDSTIIGVSLDMYLGDKYPFYASVGLPAYVSRRFKPEYIAPNVFQVIYRNMHPFQKNGRTLLDMMIQRGKEQYFLSKVLPFSHDTARLGFTGSQLEWAKASEAQVYNFFVKENLLYETAWPKILRYIDDGPSATGMPPESPGNIGSWLGLQIVKAYAGEHPESSLEQILADKDAQQFLHESKYKPK